MQHGAEASPVIIDTDIGTFADDTLALAQALGSPELDVRLVLTTSGDAYFRARVAAKQLQLSGRADIPIGIGASLPKLSLTEPLESYVAGVSLAAHQGGVYTDGPAAAVAMISNSSRHDWVIVVLGPSTSVAEMLRIEPAITMKARVTIMGASVCGGIQLPWDATTPRAATNELQDVPSARAVGAALWRQAPEYATVAASLQVALKGERWARVLASAQGNEKSQLASGMLDSYEAWWYGSRSDVAAITHQEALAIQSPRKQSVLCFDCLAVALAYSNNSPIGSRAWSGHINFSDHGYTRQRMEDPSAVQAGGICLAPTCHVSVASCDLAMTSVNESLFPVPMWPARLSLGWEDLDGFLDDLVRRLGSTDSSPSSPSSHQPQAALSAPTRRGGVGSAIAVAIVAALVVMVVLVTRRAADQTPRHRRLGGAEEFEMAALARAGEVGREREHTDSA